VRDAWRASGSRSSAYEVARLPPDRHRRRVDGGADARRVHHRLARRDDDGARRRAGRRRAGRLSGPPRGGGRARPAAGRLARSARHGQLRAEGVGCRKRFQDRDLYVHKPDDHADADNAGRVPRARAGESGASCPAPPGPTALFIPLRGISRIAVEGQPFHDADADAALLEGLRETLGPNVRGTRAGPGRERRAVSRWRWRTGSTSWSRRGDDTRRGARAASGRRSKRASRSSAPGPARACLRSAPRPAAAT